jgi:GntR family transcriptional regulator
MPAHLFSLAVRCNTRYSTRVIPLQFTFQSGTPVHEQVAFAARKAIVSGKFRSGDAFPSVRSLSRELKIHANTAQKVIAQLQQEGLLEVRPGIGTVVAQPPRQARSVRVRLLNPATEQLAVEAMRLGLTLEDLQKLVADNWRALCHQEVVRK